MDEWRERSWNAAKPLRILHAKNEDGALVHLVFRLEEPRLQMTARTDAWDRQDLDAIGGTRAPRPRQDFKWLRLSALQTKQPEGVLVAVSVLKAAEPSAGPTAYGRRRPACSSAAAQRFHVRGCRYRRRAAL